MSGRLFYEDEYDALQSMIGASGKSLKECAAFLWPDMKPASAHAKLTARLDRMGDEQFTWRQVLALMKFCGQYDPLMDACDQTMHARPDRKAPIDEEVRLTEAIEHAASVLERATAALVAARARHGSVRSVA